MNYGRMKPAELEQRDFLGGHSASVRQIVSNARANRVSLKKSRIITAYLRRRMLDEPMFFSKLPNIRGSRPALQKNEGRRKRFRGFIPKIGNVDVVVKYTFQVGHAAYTSHGEEHGFDTRDYNRFFKAYTEALRKGRFRKPGKYMLVPLNAHGSFLLPYGPNGRLPTRKPKTKPVRAMRFGYLVMERLKAKRPSRENESLTEAIEELHKHTQRVSKLNKFDAFDQKHNVLVLGREPKSGKWILALPHDYV